MNYLVTEDRIWVKLLLNDYFVYSFYFDDEGNVWTAVAHIITAVIGTGVLSLAWSMAQLGWVAGPLSMIVLAFATLFSAFVLCECYRSPDPDSGPSRNGSYMEAVNTILGKM